MQTEQTQLKSTKNSQELPVSVFKILESTCDIVGIGSPHQKLLFLNDAGRNILGIGLEEDLTQLTMADIHSADAVRKIVKEVIPKAVKDLVWSGGLEFKVRGSGKLLPASCVVQAHLDEDKKIIAFSFLARDLGPILELEEAKHLLAHRWHKIISQIDEHIVVINRDLEIVNLNRILPGFKREDIIGHGVIDFIDKEFQQDFKSGVKKVFDTGEAFVGQLRAVKDKASFTKYSFKITPFYDESKTFNEVIITAQEEAE